MLLQVNDELRHFIAVYNQHFDTVEIDDAIDFTELQQMCRKLRQKNVEPVDKWWPNRVIGGRPQLALRKNSKSVNKSVLESFEMAFESQYESIVESVLKTRKRISFKDEFEDGTSRILLAAVFTTFAATMTVYLLLSFVYSMSQLTRILSTLLSFLVISLAEGYFVSRKL